MELNLAPAFQQRIQETFGEEGEAWLNRLPALITACERRWDMRVNPPFPDLSYNYAAPAKASDGTDLVLKIGVPRAELVREIEALRLYNGKGSALLVDASADKGVLLLERLKPGEMLVGLRKDRDDEATVIGARVMQELWRPAPGESGFKSIDAWFVGLGKLRREFAGGCGPFPHHLVETAESLYAQLSQSTSVPVLLHGDLHHYNILSATRSPWLAIDPKGVMGDRAYDTATFLRNPLDLPLRPTLRSTLERRVAILAETLTLDRWRILAWGVANTVLSAWWSYEDNDSQWWRVLPVAEQLAALLS